MDIRIIQAEQRKSKPDDNSLGFGSIFTDHMFNMDYDPQNGWHNPRIEPYGPIVMDPATMMLHYGQGVFEGLKAYKTAAGTIQLFRPQENMRRLNRSCRRLCIPEVDENFLLGALRRLLVLEKDWVPGAPETSLYIRPTVIATDPFLGVRASHTYRLYIILSPVGAYYAEGFNPIKIWVTKEYVRAVRGGVGEAKTPGNYAASLLAGDEAHRRGYTQVLWLDGVEGKYLEEVGSMNIFFVVDGEIITPRLNGSILPGVTRDSVIRLARHWNIPLTERQISIDELMQAHTSGRLDEIFGSGTAAVISPVGAIKYGESVITVAEGKVGPMAEKFYRTLTDIQYVRTTQGVSMPSNRSLEHLPEFLQKMKNEELPPRIVDTFAHYYEKLVTGESGLISEKEIRPVRRDEIAAAEEVEAYAQAGQAAFAEAVRITLNGGLGTSMGLTGAKSLLAVKDGRSFLDIIVEQARHHKITLVLMNSFNTDADTKSALENTAPQQDVRSFLQHKFPKVLQKDLSPAQWPQNPELEWNPPGHGDVYTALVTSGTLDALLQEGIRFAFISNSDNLGATMEASLLGYFAEKRFPFMMEVAEKTPSDVKGGHIARHENGRLVLRESAQCPDRDKPAFRDIERHRFFNTNNVWINLEYLRDLFERENIIELPMIVNPKTVDPRDESSPAVYQIETAMGSAIGLFEGAAAIVVPRSRFFPVKKCNDLLAVRSDGYVLSESGSLTVNPERRRRGRPAVIEIDLDPDFYKKIDQFDQRFPAGPPSLVDCESLTVEGDVVFGAGVAVSGNVTLRNRSGNPVTVEPGTTLDRDWTFE